MKTAATPVWEPPLLYFTLSTTGPSLLRVWHLTLPATTAFSFGCPEQLSELMVSIGGSLQGLWHHISQMAGVYIGLSDRVAAQE